MTILVQINKHYWNKNYEPKKGKGLRVNMKPL